MIVEEIMKKEVITVMPSTTLLEATTIMKEHRIRHLPVVDDLFRLVGIISDRDVRDALPSILNHKDSSQLETPIHSIMSTNIITGTPLDFIEEVAAIFYEFKISCLPIVKREKLVGIITESDLLYTFVQLTGAHRPSSHIELSIEDRPGVLSQVSAIFQNLNLNIISILLYPSSEEHHKRLILRAQVMNTNDLVKELEKEGFDVLWPKII